MTYTVTAANATGDTAASLTITVALAQNVLLELGAQYGIVAMRENSDRVLSMDATGRWVLWETPSDTMLASGDGSAPDVGYGGQIPIDMAGSTMVIGVANGVEIRSPTDGHVMGTIYRAQRIVYRPPMVAVGFGRQLHLHRFILRTVYLFARRAGNRVDSGE